MKAVLVIDMPSNCSECPCCYENDGYFKEHSCQAMGFKKVELLEKPSWCPLRPLPQKMTMEKALKMERVGAIRDIYTTWDACLDEITGDTKKEAE